MHSYVTQNGKRTRVKNLGWLLRNWKLVKSFHIYPYPETGEPGLKPDAFLVAALDKDGTYETGFQSAKILERFLARPVFYGLACTWHIDKKTGTPSTPRTVCIHKL
jgi:hypothetical protein